MGSKNTERLRIKTVRIDCDRCKCHIEALCRDEFVSGIFDMTTWAEYRRDNERYVCIACMFADPAYVERFGSCF